MSEHLNIGKIVNTHSLNGSVRVYPLVSDMKDFESYGRVFTLGKNSETLEITSVKYKKNMVLLKFKAYNHINDIQHLIGQAIYIDKEEADNLLGEGEYLLSDLIGLNVIGEDGICYGQIVDMRSTAVQDTLEIKREDKIWFLPFVDAFVIEVDLSNGVVIRPIEGLMDEN